MDSIQQEIRQLCDQHLDRTSFCDQFLQLTSQMANAVSGIAWDCNVDPPGPIAQVQAKNEPMLEVGISELEHRVLIRQAARANQPMIVYPKHEQNDGPSEKQPVILLAKMSRPSNTELIELFVSSGRSEEEYRHQLGQLSQFCQWAQTDHSESHPSSDQPTRNPPNAAETNLSEQIALDDRLSRFVHRIHGSLDLNVTANEIASETRRVLDCDRVSVLKAQRKGRRVFSKFLAVSGQASVNQRSNTIRKLQRVADAVLPTEDPFWYPTEQPVVPQIQTPLDDYLADSPTRTLVIIPIFSDSAQELDIHEQNISSSAKPPVILIGAILIEQCRHQWNRHAVQNAVDSVTLHAADAFRNAVRHQSLFLFPLWNRLGKSPFVRWMRDWKKSAAAFFIMVALVSILAFWPSEFRLHCDGKLVPVQRRNVFAATDGSVSKVLVNHGEQVNADQSLLEIENLDLKYRHQQVVGKIQELEQQIATSESQRLNERNGSATRLSNDDVNPAVSLPAQQALLASLKEQCIVLERKLEHLNVQSPITGQVVSWDINKNLMNRPISRGDALLEIADVGGSWELNLDLPDASAGHLLAAAKESPDGLPVEFVLAADPDHRLFGQLVEIATSSQSSPDKGTTIRLRVDVDASDFDVRQVNSNVHASIRCGKRSLGFVLFRPLVEFVQRKILFPLL